MTYKKLLQKLGEKTAEKINQIKILQKEISDLLKDRTEAEMEEINNDPELKEMGQKLNKLLNEIW